MHTAMLAAADGYDGSGIDGNMHMDVVEAAHRACEVCRPDAVLTP